MRRIAGLLRDDDHAAPAMPTSTGPEAIEELVERFRRQGYEVALRLPEAGSEVAGRASHYSLSRRAGIADQHREPRSAGESGRRERHAAR
jgi:hypothetical protein